MRRIAVAFVFCLISCGTAQAADNSSATYWRALTAMDVEAAYQLLEQDHPGAAPAVGDRQFVAALARAHEVAAGRARQVANFEGYTATLGAFAAAMGDGHIWSHPLFLPRNIEWAGLVAAKRGSAWVVARDDPKVAGAELGGARILGCDGTEADALAHARLQFRADVSTDAAQAIFAGWLLVDDGNPFLPKLRQCTFDLNGKRMALTLNWKKIGYYEFFTTYLKQRFGQAGFGVRPSHDGFWISIQELDPKAQAAIDGAKANVERIRSAPFVVVDLRGNGGGDDAYGRALAETLYGSEYVASILGPKDDQDDQTGGCDSVFRASPGNIESIQADARDMEKSGDTEGAREYTAAVKAMKAALASGRALTGDPVCRKKAPSASARVPSLIHAKVFVLTDALCFSSCIGTVGFFRALGAIQVGQATGADTHYSEVHETVLPSGLSVFSTLRALMPDSPRNIGPYVPKYEYGGDIADTAALETWIAGTLVK